MQAHLSESSFLQTSTIMCLKFKDASKKLSYLSLLTTSYKTQQKQEGFSRVHTSHTDLDL